MTDEVTDVRPFLPARDYEQSLSFYEALGWARTWSDENLAVLELGNHRFYLQNYYVHAWAENCMLHVSVGDANAWKSKADAVIEQFPGTRADGPRLEAYGARVTYVWDPCGVLLHFAEWQ